MKMVKDKKDVKPLLFKFGVALVISVAGFLYSHLKNTRIRPTTRPPPSPSSSSGDMKMDAVGKAGLKDEFHSMPTTPSSSISTALITPENCASTSIWQEEASDPKVDIDNLAVGFSPSSKHYGDKEGFLVPEFNYLVHREFEIPPLNTGASLKEEVETPMTNKRASNEEMEQEIINLRTMVRVLREREMTLETQLLEYYGLKEQNATVLELQNRLKIHMTETKLFTLKIESLQADNQRLKAQVADYSKVVAELESEREKIKLLKRKIRFHEEQNKEQLSTLQQRVANLQNHEHKAVGKVEVAQNKLQRLMELEDELVNLRSVNLRLQQENSNLARELESTQNFASSVLEVPEFEALQEANHRLRQQNDDLTKEIEQLQENRCADVEELVYLRWVNACLRYELRNYQGPPGKTVARDLSKTLSPRSEEKAKQLILEYSNLEGMDKGVSLMDFDYEDWLSSQDSNLTESGDLDDTSIDISSATRTNNSTKSKIFNKLKRLVRGNNSYKISQASSVDRIPNQAASRKTESVSAGSFEEMMRTDSCGSSSSHPNSSISAKALTKIETKTDEQRNEITPTSQSSLRPSLDIQRLRNQNLEDKGRRRNSDLGSSYEYKRLILREGNDDGLPQNYGLDQDPNAPEKQKLMKFAKVFGSSGTPKLHRRCASYSSC